MASEIVAEVFKHMQKPISIEFFYWPKSYNNAVTGYAIGSYVYYYTEKRAKNLLYSDPLFEAKEVFFYRKSQQSILPKFKKLSDLIDYKIAGVRGFYYKGLFKEAGLNVSYSSTEMQALQMVADGKADLIAMNEIVGWNLIKKLYPEEINDFAVIDKVVHVKPTFFVFSKKNEKSKELLAKFNESLSILKHKGTIDKIISSYDL